MSNIVWKTASETAEILGISKVRVSQLARAGRFGRNAHKKYQKDMNYNGSWMIPFPNDYQKKSVGRPSKDSSISISI
jgi:hypothetical protein